MAASSLVSKPTSTLGSSCGGRRLSTASRTLGLSFAAQPAAFAVVVSRTCSVNVISPWNTLDDYSARRLRTSHPEQAELSCQTNQAAYACAAADLIGMVIGLAVSVAASMWQR